MVPWVLRLFGSQYQEIPMINYFSISKKAKTLTSSSCVKLSSSARSGPASACDSDSVPWHDHACEGWEPCIFICAHFVGSQTAKKGHLRKMSTYGSEPSVSMMMMMVYGYMIYYIIMRNYNHHIQPLEPFHIHLRRPSGSQKKLNPRCNDTIPQTPKGKLEHFAHERIKTRVLSSPNINVLACIISSGFWLGLSGDLALVEPGLLLRDPMDLDEDDLLYSAGTSRSSCVTKAFNFSICSSPLLEMRR